MGALSVVQKNMQAWAGDYTPPTKKVPIHAVPLNILGFVQSPAYGPANQALILTYTVRANWACLITHIVLGFAGPAPAPLPGDITWAIDIDRPLGSQAGYFEKDYGAVQIPLGTFSNLPWPVNFSHRNNEVIRVKGITNQNVGTGAGSFLTAALLGYEWPEEDSQ